MSSTDEDNNKRIEQEEWHLRQTGGVLEGFYVRTVTVVSGDENLFRCNGQRKFQKRMRFHVQGRVTGEAVALQETAVQVEPGPCGTAQHDLQSYAGRAAPRSLTLVWDAELPTGMHQRGQQILFRRPSRQPEGSPEVAQEDPFRAAAESSEPPAAEITGMWTWEMHGMGWDGDAKIEQEEWHIEQAGNQIRGYYDRIVTSISADGNPYRCNHQTQFATLTRYKVEGLISGHEIQIRELSFDTKPSQCEERPQRRLDVYRGNIGSEEINLTWGTGQQVLRRARPPVPTSSF